MYGNAKQKGEEDMRREKRVSDSSVETMHAVRPVHLNGAGRLFGGQLMEWLDEVAGLVGRRHAEHNITTASVDNLRFIHGVYLDKVVVVIGKATYVGKTSMEVRVDTYVENRAVMRRPMNRAYIAMVVLDENGRPAEIPGYVVEIEDEKWVWGTSRMRREMRMKRREERI